jgi:myo-inositol-1(or 4)-monophosphatase
MAYVSPLLTSIVEAVKKSASSLDRDFYELEKLQNSIRGNKNFVMNSYMRLVQNLKNELAQVRPNLPIFTPNDKVVGTSYFAVSPIEGIVNFAHGHPDFAVSVALVEDDVILDAVVYNPVRDETFFAEKGKGAYKEGYRNHERLRVSATKDLDGALVASTSSFGKDNFKEVAGIHQAVLKKTGNLRISGSLAMDLAYLAGGKYDASISFGNHICSMAGGLLLVKEAGGSIRAIGQKDIRTEDLNAVMATGDLIAVNFNLNQKVFEILK